MKRHFFGALASGKLDNEELASEVSKWTADQIRLKTGIECRSVCSEGESALTLGHKAAAKAIEAGATPDLIILCTQSLDERFPSGACRIQDSLGLPKSTGAFDLNLGCSGYPYSLGVAKGLVSSGVSREVLLITADAYTRLCDPNDFGVRAVFGDGATATIVDHDFANRVDHFKFGTDGSGGDFLSAKIPQGGESDEEYLNMEGPEIFNFTIREIPRFLDSWFETENLSPADIDYFVFHQANAFMLEHLRKKLKIPNDKFPVLMSNIGNTVSSSIPFVLEQFESEGRLNPGMKICLVGFGVGLSWSVCVLDI